jgi:hypothetical protein
MIRALTLDTYGTVVDWRTSPLEPEESPNLFMTTVEFWKTNQRGRGCLSRVSFASVLNFTIRRRGELEL